METAPLKNFATWARKELIREELEKLGGWTTGQILQVNGGTLFGRG